MHVSSSPLTPGTLFQTSKSPVVHTSVMLVNILVEVLSSGYHHGIADGVMVLSSTLMGELCLSTSLVFRLYGAF